MRRPLLISLVLLILIAAAAAAFYGWQSLNRFQLAQELRGALILTSEKSGGGMLYQWDGKTFTPLTAPTVRVEAAARAGNHTAMITRLPNDTAFAVQLDGKTLYVSPTLKEGLSLSPDATKIAFAELFSASVATTSVGTSTASAASSTMPAAPNAVTSWRSVVIEVPTSASTTYPASFSPYFLSNSLLVRFTPTGLIGSDLSAPEKGDVVYNADPFTDPMIFTAIAPDAKDIGWQTPDKGKSVLFWFPSLPQHAPARLLTLSLQPSSTFGISDTAFYDIRYKSDRIEVWYRTDSRPKPFLVYKFPQSVHVRSILF